MSDYIGDYDFEIRVRKDEVIMKGCPPTEIFGAIAKYYAKYGYEWCDFGRAKEEGCTLVISKPESITIKKKKSR